MAPNKEEPVVLPWLILALVVFVASAALWWTNRSHQNELHLLKQKHTESLVVQEEEHRSHVKRLKREHQKALQRAPQGLVKTLLPRMDALQHALEASQQDNTTVEDLEQGLALLWKDWCKALEEHKINIIEPTPGDTFDPKLHEAVGMMDAPTLPEGHIAQMLRSGWKHQDDLLRPATVQTVAKHVASTTHEELPRTRPPVNEEDKTGVLGVMDFVETTDPGQDLSELELEDPPTRVVPTMPYNEPNAPSPEPVTPVNDVFNIRPNQGPAKDLDFDDSTAVSPLLAPSNDFADEQTRVSPVSYELDEASTDDANAGEEILQEFLRKQRQNKA